MRFAIGPRQRPTRCVALEVRILSLCFASGRWGSPSLPHLAMHNYSVVGVMPGGTDRAFKRRAQEALVAHHRRGEIRVPVHRALPFEALPEGLDELARGRVQGKAVLTVASAPA